MHQARLFGVASPEQAMAIMLKGYELGLSLTASFEFVQIVEGKPALSPRGALALIHNSPVCAGVKVEDITDKNGKPIACRVWMKRTNGFEYTVTWTIEDAAKAGVVKPGSGWEKYPRNMLAWRAIGFCADIVFPDVIGGMKRTDELGADITADGETIEPDRPPMEASVKPVPLPDQLVPQMRGSVPTLADLAARYGAEKVMEVNAGKIPGTDEELAAVAAKLAGND